MPGGKIPPDGRPPVAPGVGKTARRHDLEAPATPGLADSDLQQGDVQALEQAQKVAPRAKRTQPPAAGRVTPRGNQPSGRAQAAQPDGIPDPVEMAGRKIGGKEIGTSESVRTVDTSQWLPLLQQMALAPNSGGALTANLMNMLRAYRQHPVVSETVFMDLQELDDIVDRSL